MNRLIFWPPNVDNLIASLHMALFMQMVTVQHDYPVFLWQYYWEFQYFYDMGFVLFYLGGLIFYQAIYNIKMMQTGQVLERGICCSICLYSVSAMEADFFIPVPAIIFAVLYVAYRQANVAILILTIVPIYGVRRDCNNLDWTKSGSAFPRTRLPF